MWLYVVQSWELWQPVKIISLNKINIPPEQLILHLAESCRGFVFQKNPINSCFGIHSV